MYWRRRQVKQEEQDGVVENKGNHVSLQRENPSCGFLYVWRAVRRLSGAEWLPMLLRNLCPRLDANGYHAAALMSALGCHLLARLHANCYVNAVCNHSLKSEGNLDMVFFAYIFG